MIDLEILIRFWGSISICISNIRSQDTIILPWSGNSICGSNIRSNVLIESTDRIRFIWFCPFKIKKYLKIKLSPFDTFYLILKVKCPLWASVDNPIWIISLCITFSGEFVKMWLINVLVLSVVLIGFKIIDGRCEKSRDWSLAVRVRGGSCCLN